MQQESADTMINDRFEVFHIKDLVEEENTLYHYHSFYEIHCTLQGTAIFFIDGGEFHLEAGTIILIPPNVLHRILHQTSDSFERSYIYINSNYLQALSTAQTDLTTCFQINGGLNSRILRIAPTLLESLLFPLKDKLDSNFGTDLVYQSFLIDFLITINKLAIEETEPLFLSHSINQNKDIVATIKYIDAHLSDDLSLNKVAKAIFLSPYVLSRLFKKETGVTFHTYVLKKRLLKSKEILRQTRRATDTFDRCGFKSYTHFLRCFKQEFNMTPKEFLKEEEKNELIRFEHFGH
ncbi:AraC family transcriptional regulator [Enterococcus sp. DIV0876]|uniref:AraC family transcriptional regulator n=1 Tax=Enterococcus sp. DIV0876 TaxID=2774633 RepID=UPI003D2FFAC8